MAEKRGSDSLSAEAEISNAIVKLTREWTGRGPTEAKTTIVDDLVIVRLEEVLLKAEAKLIGTDHTEAVLTMRAGSRSRCAMRWKRR